MSGLTEYLRSNEQELRLHVKFGAARWKGLVELVEKFDKEEGIDCPEEVVWTFLLACSYAAGGLAGVSALARMLLGSTPPTPPHEDAIWLEPLPMSPRIREKNTHLDMAIGSIKKRSDTTGGIVLSCDKSPWVCFCEMKWYSDIAYRVENDLHRNQLARVVENALYFQRKGTFCSSATVTLVTPGAFRDRENDSRFYASKFKEYVKNKDLLFQDIKACNLKKRDDQEWAYPTDLEERINRIDLRWLTFEELFQAAPKTDLSIPLQHFRELHDFTTRKVPADQV